MRKLIISLAGAVVAATAVSGVAFAKGPNAASGGQGQGFSRGPDLTRVHGANDTPGVPRGRGPDWSGPAGKGLNNALSHISDQGKAHGLPFRTHSGG